MEISINQAMRAKEVWSVFLRTITITSIFYLAAQIYFAIATVVGLMMALGLEDSLILSTVDYLTFGTVEVAGQSLLIVGMIGALICGMLTFVVSTAIFYLGNCNPFRGVSVLILVTCIVALLMPFINLLPVMWLWNLYVGWSNAKI